MRSKGPNAYATDASPLQPSATAPQRSSSFLLQTIGASLAFAAIMMLFVQYSAVGGALKAVDRNDPHPPVQMEPISLHVRADDPSAQIPVALQDSQLMAELLTKLQEGTNGSSDNIKSDEGASFEIFFNGVQVEPDDYVPMKEATSPPTIEISGNGLFTWILIDIDAPNPENPNHSPFLHYIVVNLSQDHPLDNQVVESYFPVSPPIGEHRYVSLLFAQQSPEPALDQKAPQEPFKRSNFDVLQYVSQHKLEYIACTEFYSKPE